MSREQMALDPHDMNSGTGVGGRMLDMLKKNGYQTSGNTIDGTSLFNSAIHTTVILRLRSQLVIWN